jgi:hypothetical protein
MEEQKRLGTATGATTATRGVCEECGRHDALTARVDPESPLSDTRRLCAACAQEPEPFWADER